MANERLSELTEQTNPVDTDLVEVSNYTGVADPETGSLYQSLRLTLLNLYTYILNKLKAVGSANTITSHAFLAEDNTYEYTATRYEFVETIILKGLASGETATIDYYTLNLATGNYDANSITVEDSNIININNYFDSSVTFERNISISPSANCTIIIKSVKGL